jgi:ADP-dependent NAD(P)H-hydrate dehydratase
LEIVNLLNRLANRPQSSHKGHFGRVVVVAGSRGMSGAAVLCGSAALRTGAGLVTIAVPNEIQPVVAMGNPCYMTAGLSQDLRGRFAASALDELQELVQTASVVAIGPGLGQSESLTRLLRGLIEETRCPIVVDADGLNAVREMPEEFWTRRPLPTVFTPHPGEFARLTGKTTTEVEADRENLAIRFATERKLVVLLKGHRTVVTDGQRIYRNRTGNPGMATGGSGDVLTGMIAALIGQGATPFEAAFLGAYLHGIAGDLGTTRLGQMSLTASDILAEIPNAILETLGRATEFAPETPPSIPRSKRGNESEQPTVS